MKSAFADPIGNSGKFPASPAGVFARAFLIQNPAFKHDTVNASLQQKEVLV